jgi:serine/alanine adding enzyme
MISSNRILSPHDGEQWLLLSPSRHSVFAHPEFMGLSEPFNKASARLFVFETAKCRIVHPFFLRRINDLSFVGNSLPPCFDVFTPPYTGPLGPVDSEDALLFYESWHSFCVSHNFVCEFAHLHPWNSIQRALSYNDIYADRMIVYVDLIRSVDDLWSNSFNHACRKNINRSAHSSLSLFAAESEQDIVQFHEIYTSTMRRNNASSSYYFPVEYFKAIFNRMPDHSRFALAALNGKVIAGTLYLHDSDNIFSYLGGADYAHQVCRPTNAIVYDTILWGMGHAKKRLVLGGGYTHDDGIFRFKSSFSPLQIQFRVYRHIHLPDIFNKIKALSETSLKHPLTDISFFPPYRNTGN